MRGTVDRDSTRFVTFIRQVQVIEQKVPKRVENRKKKKTSKSKSKSRSTSGPTSGVHWGGPECLPDVPGGSSIRAHPRYGARVWCARLRGRPSYGSGCLPSGDATLAVPEWPRAGHIQIPMAGAFRAVPEPKPPGQFNLFFPGVPSSRPEKCVFPYKFLEPSHSALCLLGPIGKSSLVMEVDHERIVNSTTDRERSHQSAERVVAHSEMHARIYHRASTHTLPGSRPVVPA